MNESGKCEECPSFSYPFRDGSRCIHDDCNANEELMSNGKCRPCDGSTEIGIKDKCIDSGGSTEGEEAKMYFIELVK